LRDLRQAIRALRATPVVTAVAALSLALGIGANTAIFSLVNGLVLRTLPVKDPARLTLLSDTTDHARAWSYPIWLQIHQRGDLFESAAAWSATRFNLTSGGGDTRFIEGVWVSGSFFDTLGVTPFAGRLIAPADDRRDLSPDGPVAVVSYGFWQRQFGGAADIIGRRITLDNAAFTIVGVTPREFFGAEIGRAFDVVVPLAAEPLSRGRDTTSIRSAPASSRLPCGCGPINPLQAPSPVFVRHSAPSATRPAPRSERSAARRSIAT